MWAEPVGSIWMKEEAEEEKAPPNLFGLFSLSPSSLYPFTTYLNCKSAKASATLSTHFHTIVCCLRQRAAVVNITSTIAWESLYNRLPPLVHIIFLFYYSCNQRFLRWPLTLLFCPIFNLLLLCSRVQCAVHSLYVIWEPELINTKWELWSGCIN